jgi:hypothetical protein
MENVKARLSNNHRVSSWTVIYTNPSAGKQHQTVLPGESGAYRAVVIWWNGESYAGHGDTEETALQNAVDRNPWWSK